MPKKKINYKKECWTLFSQYIRKKNADWQGNGKCVTCGVVKPWKQLQAGHFVDGRNNKVLLDERLVHPQCYQCNVPLKGNKIKYFEFMRSLGYTEKQLYKFGRLRYEVTQLKEADWIQAYNELKLKLMQEEIE